MKQELKNKYYNLIENKDYDTLSLINSIFSEIDTLLLMNRGKNQIENLPKILNKFGFDFAHLRSKVYLKYNTKSYLLILQKY